MVLITRGVDRPVTRFSVLSNCKDRFLWMRVSILLYHQLIVNPKLICKRFMYHLAQMKHIFPEGLLLEKTMTLDEKTLCMNPDLKITLLHDVVLSGKDKASKGNNTLGWRKSFHTCLVAFVKDCPKASLLLLSCIIFWGFYIFLVKPFNSTGFNFVCTLYALITIQGDDVLEVILT